MEEVIEFSMKVSDMRDIAKEIVSYKIIEHFNLRILPL